MRLTLCMRCISPRADTDIRAFIYSPGGSLEAARAKAQLLRGAEAMDAAIARSLAAAAASYAADGAAAAAAAAAATAQVPRAPDLDAAADAAHAV
jgi:ATP-dependent protease ClpP protease subunit